MSYRIYHTKGFVLNSRSFGEANKVFKILTPNLGLVSCLAQGVRFEKSKLRFALARQRFVKISLVRGREYWRLIHVEPDLRFGAGLESSNVNLFLAQISTLLSRFIHGEKKDPQLYQILEEATLSKINLKKGSPFSQQSLEVLTMTRILSVLGYRPDDPKMSFFVDSNDWQEKTVSDFYIYLPRAIQSINTALHNSQL